MYMSGEGTRQDQAEAFRWYLKAAEQGNAAAQYQVGQMQYQSCGRFSDEKGIHKAFDWFMKAAKQGHRKAQMQVGNMYLRGDQTAEDAQQALYWFRKAAEQGHVQAVEMVQQLEAPAEPEVVEETEPDAADEADCVADTTAVAEQQEMTDEPPVQTEGETVEAEQEEPVAVVAEQWLQRNRTGGGIVPAGKTRCRQKTIRMPWMI